MNFEKWRYDFEILVQKPGYSALPIEKNCNRYMVCIFCLLIFYDMHYQLFLMSH